MTFAFALATSSLLGMPPAPAQANIVIPLSSQLLGAEFDTRARPGREGAPILTLHSLSPLLRARLVGGGTYIAEAGDIITSVNDRRVLNEAGLAARLRGMSSGDEVKLGIVDVRTGRTVHVWVKLD
ncbi:PDZ domain-containing protein [Polyangium sorediatum]|uniref:PDZ domain-containing protein n=1 Tax=Polyangium sorediatum TaxID=889274 RepID=A0ABT6P777_9BACT|nr:PDZ domain-containing protein [Polyangium sorediatum]MDI1436480.1 PDZ domain-containing protein [Polyangium sorediatum]